MLIWMKSVIEGVRPQMIFIHDLNHMIWYQVIIIDFMKAIEVIDRLLNVKRVCFFSLVYHHVIVLSLFFYALHPDRLLFIQPKIVNNFHDGSSITNDKSIDIGWPLNYIYFRNECDNTVYPTRLCWIQQNSL